jgi:hypothetical protein
MARLLDLWVQYLELRQGGADAKLSFTFSLQPKRLTSQDF